MDNVELKKELEKLRRQLDEVAQDVVDIEDERDRLRKDLRAANQRTYRVSQRAGIQRKALEHVKKACCPHPVCDKENGPGWCPIRRALKRKLPTPTEAKDA